MPKTRTECPAWSDEMLRFLNQYLLEGYTVEVSLDQSPSTGGVLNPGRYTWFVRFTAHLWHYNDEPDTVWATWKVHPDTGEWVFAAGEHSEREGVPLPLDELLEDQI